MLCDFRFENGKKFSFIFDILNLKLRRIAVEINGP